MPTVRTIQTVRHEVEGEAEIDATPQFKVGDYVVILSRDHHFWIKDVRFNRDRSQYEYFCDNFLDGGWWLEAALDRG